MFINPDHLLAYGAVAKKYKKNEFVFYEGDSSRFYFQVYEGNVKMCSFNDEGRSFTQGIFGPGESFGEPPLFINATYPACAVAESDCVIFKLSKDTLFKLLVEFPELQMKFITHFAKRIYDKTNKSKNIVSPHPAERIIGFLNRYKADNKLPQQRVLIPFTRQQMADFLGLRVETVIRTLKKMEEEKKVEIRKHKLYY